MTPALQLIRRVSMLSAARSKVAQPKLQKELTKMFKNFLKDETGAELAEYAVGVALLVAIGLVVYKVLGNAINTSNSATGSDINTASYP